MKAVGALFARVLGPLLLPLFGAPVVEVPGALLMAGLGLPAGARKDAHVVLIGALFECSSYIHVQY